MYETTQIVKVIFYYLYNHTTPKSFYILSESFDSFYAFP
jgi:hypothetical protein